MRLILGLLLASTACASQRVEGARAEAPAGQMQAEVETKVDGDLVVRSFDLNRDKKADDWKYFRLVADPKDPARKIELLVRRELDTNFDGKPDIWTWFNEDGTKSKEEFDLDFDGKPDVVDHFDHGVLIRKETWHLAQAKPDQVTFYENGRKVRIERDSRGAGKVDTWEYFEDGKLVRIGQDLDGDGNIDRWVKARDDEEEDLRPAPQGKPATRVRP